MYPQEMKNQRRVSNLSLLSTTEFDSEFIEFDYSDVVLLGNEHAFNAIQIQPFSFSEDESMEGEFFDGFDQTFVGLYLHMTEGGIVRVGTFGSVDQAEEAASKLACKHDWPIYNFIR